MASADEPSDTRERAMRVEFTPLRREDVGLRWQTELLAAALATTSGNARDTAGAASASAEVAITTSADCDLVAAGGQVAARSDDRVVSAQQWASVCPAGGNGHIALDHRLEWDVTPRLLAAPRLRPGHQRRETIGFDFFGSTTRTNDPGPLALVPPPPDWEQAGVVRLELQFGWSEIRDTNEVRAMTDIVLRKFRREYGDDQPMLELSVVTTRLEVLAAPGPDEAVVASLSGDLARLEGLRVGGGLRLGGRLGGRFAGLTRGREETYEIHKYGVGEAGASVERDLIRNLTLRLAGDRRGWPTWDGRFVVDDRATLSVFGKRGRLRGRLDVAAANVHLLEIDARRDVLTGGITAEAELELGSHVTVKARSEAGRSVYAVGSTFEEPAWASESMLMLATRAGRRR